MSLMAEGQTTEPPFLLDAARVVAFAVLPQGPGIHFSAVVEGVSLDPRSVSRLVVAANLVDDAIFLLHCNESWQTVAAAPQADAAAARAAAAEAYAGIPIDWIPYRSLTPAEEREIEATRAFLRELAAGGLDQ
jgi:hypothetical protein